MRWLRDKVQAFDRALDRLPPELTLTVGFVVVSWAVAVTVPDLGADVASQFYAAVAAIVPVVLLALLVEVRDVAPLKALAARMDRIDARLDQARAMVADAERETGGLPDLAIRARAAELLSVEPEHAETRAQLDEASKLMQGAVRAAFGAAFVCEFAALYALGADRSTTFLLSLSVLPLFVLGFVLFWLWNQRFAVRR